MANTTQEKGVWQDRSTTFWSLIAMGVVSLCFGTLVCGLGIGVGLVSILDSFDSSTVATNTVLTVLSYCTTPCMQCTATKT